MKLGFIGLGIMGTPMAGHLKAGGHELFVTSRSKVPQVLLDAGAVACASAREVAASADIVFTMVPDTPDVEAVLFGKNGVAEGLSAGKTVVDMSSISPIETKAFAKKINALGCDYLDAPVSGGEVGAKAASLTIMVGGPEATFEKVKPLFYMEGFSACRLIAAEGGYRKQLREIVVYREIHPFTGKPGAPALVSLFTALGAQPSSSPGTGAAFGSAGRAPATTATPPTAWARRPMWRWMSRDAPSSPSRRSACCVTPAAMWR